MSLRRLSPLFLVALFGMGIAVLPALGASSEAKLEASKNCEVTGWACWTSSSGLYPQPATVTKIAQGGTVKFIDGASSGVSAGVQWSGSAPSCTPAAPTSATSGWESTCTFAQPGVYMFESPTMYATYTHYEIVVEGATGTTPTNTSAEPGSSTPSGLNPSGAGSQSQGASQPGGSLGSVFVGTVSHAVKLAASQRGDSVHGSVDVSPAGSGGTLQVQLFVARAELASSGHTAHVQVGRLVRPSLPAGAVSFAVALDAKAKHALRRHGRLALTVKIALSAANGSPAAVTRSVTLHG